MRFIIPTLLFVAFASACQSGPLQVSEKSTRAIVVSRDETRPGGLAFRRTEVTASGTSKLSADPSVVAVLPNRPIKVPPVPGPRQNMFEESPWGVSLRSEPVRPAMWMATQIHNAPQAWASGYTGKGVKIAVLDEGIDFGHPDLQGCQARVTDQISPYYGWPVAFDPGAMAIYASEGYTTGGYIDTYETMTPGAPTWRGRNYKLPGTSISGEYHVGAHGSYWLPFILAPWGYPPAVLVADEQSAGVYDTVYVDLNKNLDFTDDHPCRRGDEISSFDADHDGLADYSGGMLYFIADGKNPVPASDWLYDLPAPENGCLVCFAGAFGKYESHGTLVTSAISARGKVGTTYKIPQKPDGSGGIVQGVAPGAEIISVGTIYNSEADLYDAIQFAINGYDGIPGTDDDADIVNMSFGVSSEDLDGWDFLSRYITYLNKTTAPSVTFVASSGNGGPGYGTVTSPGGASSALTVGASTLYGSTDGLDPIKSADQILFGDIQQWSNRGPNALGQIKPEVVATGAWATGDVPIYGYGEGSWLVWAGTSLSAPITSGVTSLVYEAYKARTGRFPTAAEAKEIMMSSCKDLCYNTLEQGAGMIDAARATEIAAGTGGFKVDPPVWSAARGKTPESFPSVLKPGEKAAKTFTIENTSPKPLKLMAYGRRLVRSSWSQFDLTTKLSAESPEADIYRPDYLVDLSRYVPKGTDLLRVRVSFPYPSFSLIAPAYDDLRPSSTWIASLYDWSDLNGNRRVWKDSDHNRVVNADEFEIGEVNRFMLANPTSDVIEISVREPMDRIHDGLLLGLIHGARSASIPATTLKIEVESYKEANWDWLSTVNQAIIIPARGRVQIPASVSVPSSATAGIYTGSLVLRTFADKNARKVTVPVSVSVAANASRTTIAAGSDGLGDTYDNGRMFGSFDWSWREESGDWRQYFIDVPPAKPGAATYLLANANWLNMPSDTDVLIYRPEKDDFFSQTMPEVFGPNNLTLAGGSRNAWLHDGVWKFQTATGDKREWVAGRTEPGLHLIQLHNTLASGYAGSEPFTLAAGQVTISPAKLDLTPGQTSLDVKLSSTLGLSGIETLAFGPNAPTTFTEQTIGQDYRYDPRYSSWTRDITVDKAGLIEVTVTVPRGNDLDAYLLWDSNTDGKFDWDNEVVASSATDRPSEQITYYLPTDGRYRIAVHGYRVPDQATFDTSVLVINGKGIQVPAPTGPVIPGREQLIRLGITGAEAGMRGIVFLGPAGAPGVIRLPVTVGF